MKVDFFLIGPPRCASTSLASFLAEHPQVCFSRPKEPTFFCSDLPSGYAGEPETIDEYHKRFFSHYDPSHHKLLGEGTPLYLMSETAIAAICSYNPNARFIALVRNPIDIAHSMHAARLRVGLNHENIVDFEQAWAAQEARRNGRHLPKNVIREGVLQYRKLASLGSQYQRLFEQVPRQQIHVIVFDDLKKDFGSVSQDLLRFLELENHGMPESVHNEKATKWKSEWARQFYFRLARLSANLPFTPKIGLLKKLRKAGEKTTPPPALRPEFRASLRAELDGEIRLLSDVLGRDFTHWS